MIRDFELVSPADEAQRRAYHEIRRRVLFEDRGRFGVYDENHPDDGAAGHHAKLLRQGSEAVGVIRIDIAGNEAVFRRVAIRTDLQRRGYGRELLARAEEFARHNGCSRLRSYVAREAVGFYLKCGFSREGDPSSGDSVIMTKQMRAAADHDELVNQVVDNSLRGTRGSIGGREVSSAPEKQSA